MIAELNRELLRSVTALLKGLLDSWAGKPIAAAPAVMVSPGLIRYIEVIEARTDGEFCFPRIEDVVGVLREEGLIRESPQETLRCWHTELFSLAPITEEFLSALPLEDRKVLGVFKEVEQGLIKQYLIARFYRTNPLTLKETYGIVSHSQICRLPVKLRRWVDPEWYAESRSRCQGE